MLEWVDQWSFHAISVREILFPFNSKIKVTALVTAGLQAVFKAVFKSSSRQSSRPFGSANWLLTSEYKMSFNV
jgi:hypothetical protein